ncbi:rifin [Plasmodium falciparum NF54]|uniref:Rifin n=2 Tax=Plasmodium falciparum TaxID=5833 RepID=Q8I2C5_PLAF7|nr:rifin [Plasmodium falciparum 3D7]KAF4328332.1 rifin [Plasmodium falciparum NF54]PKC48076.1 rifin [Plasmodium falciparum NF54]CAD48968.1 rifin [Plasmodium falciparum 3D7]|eukprot:XP_001351078.1 rifin [Plasmodium falciparum 3D7]
MKVHYINILLFALPLNILIYNQRNHKSTTHHTLKIPITRLLCECDIYTSIYDNDPQMKEVMDNFNRQTQQRFHEYDERMQGKRQKCKDKCDKEIQKIILKDKLEKELMDKFATLHTDMQSDSIPTCVCEKSVADKVEKNYMKCTQNLGGIVAPSSGVLAGIAELGLSAWKTTALKTAIAAAEQAGAAKGLAAGAAKGATRLIELIQSTFKIQNIAGKSLGTFIDATNYNNGPFIYQAIYTKFEMSLCLPVFPGVDPVPGAVRDPTFCNLFEKFVPTNGSSNRDSIINAIETYVQPFVSDAKFTAAATAETATEEATAVLITKKTGEVTTTYASYQTAIIASIVAILVIVLVMIIIYLILRYRRKKKMKKKLQYIKLLEE